MLIVCKIKAASDIFGIASIHIVVGGEWNNWTSDIYHYHQQIHYNIKTKVYNYSFLTAKEPVIKM